MSINLRRNLLFLIDRIEDSSYPVTETGYALVYRAWLRSLEHGGDIYVAYPDATWRETASGELFVRASRLSEFLAAPYQFYRSQRAEYRPGGDVGSPRCHVESEACEVCVNAMHAAVWRQETGEPQRARELLEALARVERDTIIYQSPRLALDPRYSSKHLPRVFEPALTPRTFHTSDTATTDLRDKALHAVAFVRGELQSPETVIAKPLYGDNGLGIHVLGVNPITGKVDTAVDDRDAWQALLESYGDLVVQEYIPSVRSPVGDAPDVLAAVPVTRHDFGEIRCLLIDGQVPRGADGRPCVVARRVPQSHSLIADSGISHPTSLTEPELEFLDRLGHFYQRLGIYFGGGDLIRTPDPARPFVFTDAAQSVCGHAVVTGALNGDPYLIVDKVLDSLERQIAGAGAARVTFAFPGAEALTRV